MKLNRDLILLVGIYLAALLLPLAFDPFASLPFEPVKIRLFQWITLSMLVAAIVLTARQSRFIHIGQSRARLALPAAFNLLNENPLLAPVLVYLTVLTAATLASINRGTSWSGPTTGQGLLGFASLATFFFMVTTAVRRLEQIDRLINMILVGSVPVTLYGWAQYLGFDPLIWSSKSLSPVHSTLGYSLYLGAYLSMVIPFTLARILDARQSGWRRSYPYVLILAAQVACLMFTLARGAWLGMLGSVLLFLWLLARQWHRRTLLALSGAILVLGSALFLWMNRGWVIPPPEHVVQIPDRQIAGTRLFSNNQRTLLWIYTLPMIRERPLLGYGPDTYAAAFSQHYRSGSVLQLDRLFPWDPHSILLNHLIGAGILGLLALLWVVARFFRVTLGVLHAGADSRSVVLATALLSSAVAFLIQSQFNPSSIVQRMLFWLVLGLGVSLCRIAKAATVRPGNAE